DVNFPLQVNKEERIMQDERPPEVRVSAKGKEITIRWEAGKGRSVKSWWLYVGTKAKNGGDRWEIFNGDKGKATQQRIPADRFPRGRDVYIRVEGSANAHDKSGRAIPEVILSDEARWRRPELQKPATKEMMEKALAKELSL